MALPFRWSFDIKKLRVNMNWFWITGFRWLKR